VKKKPEEHEEEGEEEGEHGHGLAGGGAGQAARRRWFFAHHPQYSRLREHHGQRAKEHRAKAEQHKKETPRDRNKRAHHEHLANHREYEEKRIEREESRRTWQALKRETMEHGGIKASSLGEDYAAVPSSVRTRNKNAPTITDMATIMGYEGDTDAFVKLLSSTQGRASRAAQETPARPVRPTFEKEGPRFNPLTRHSSPEVRVLHDQWKETRTMLREGEKELGKGHPALAELAAMVRETRHEYVEASRERGERPAAA
jgi:hypothetical protein